MTDRELLELAAKAAGIHLDPNSQNPRYRQVTDILPEWVYWNPLTDDGDALRLAVEIGPLEFGIAEYGTAVRQPKGRWWGCEAHLYGGKSAATRRSIVLAAAEIGKSRPAPAPAKEAP